MSDLRELLTSLGFTRVQTLLQSGNVVFEAKDRTPAELEILLADETEARFGFRTEYMVRTPSELADVVAKNPFADEAVQDPGHLLVLFMKSEPDAAAIEALQKGIVGREVIHADGRHIYAIFPDGIGDSKLTSQLDRRLGKLWTGRNWNTVSKLFDMTRDA